MLPANEAEKIILDRVVPLSAHQDVETIGLSAAYGRVLAASVTSSLDFPHWDNSAMDGYAVRFADVTECSPEHPADLTIVEEIPAGYQPQQMIQPGQAARIMTGAVMPTGADTVVMQENTRRDKDRIMVFSAPDFQSFVRHQGSFYQAGHSLLPAGIRLLAPDIAVLAAAQCVNVPVFRRPRVAILSTGDELVTPDQLLRPGQIVDSNQIALAALVASIGAEPIDLGIIPDRPEALKEAIAYARSQADMILSSGGVSVGDYDYVDRILVELGGDIHVRSVAVKPGKPLTVATFGSQNTELASQRQDTILNGASSISSTLYFGLPGNPASALVSFWRFVQPALRKLSGMSDSWSPTIVKGRSRHDLKSGGQRETYLWGRVNSVKGAYEFQLPGGSHSSGNLINLAQTNALAIVPIGETTISAGQPVQIMLI
ncbi:MAG TPA: gephyrin-like molybdotransferase Glp [Elainellaceae cyanobacterium]